MKQTILTLTLALAHYVLGWAILFALVMLAFSTSPTGVSIVIVATLKAAYMIFWFPASIIIEKNLLPTTMRIAAGLATSVAWAITVMYLFNKCKQFARAAK